MRKSMMNWTEARIIIEKNGLMLVAVAIILFYWAIDIITEGRMVSRLLITISLLAYGIFTQFLINAQKAAKESLRDSEEKHRLMIETLPLAVFVDTQGIIVYINQAFLTLFKLSSRDEIIGKRLIQFIPPGFFDTYEQGRRIMIDEKIAIPPLEVNIQRKDGMVITVLATPMPVIYDRQPAILCVLNDITEHKHDEIELQKAHKLLHIQNSEIEDLQAKLKG